MRTTLKNLFARKKNKNKGAKSQSTGSRTEAVSVPLAASAPPLPAPKSRRHRQQPPVATVPVVTVPVVAETKTELDAKPKAAPSTKPEKPAPAAKIDETVFERIPGPAQPTVSSTTESHASENGDDAFADDDDAPQVVLSYESIPVLEQVKLPRGGFSVDTKAVGRVQVGGRMDSLDLSGCLLFVLLTVNVLCSFVFSVRYPP